MSSQNPTAQELETEAMKWRMEKTLSRWIHREIDDLIELNFKHLEGKILTLLEATIPNAEQLKAVKDIVKDIVRDVWTSAAQYSERIGYETACEIEELSPQAQDRPIQNKELEYKYSRSHK